MGADYRNARAHRLPVGQTSSLSLEQQLRPLPVKFGWQPTGAGAITAMKKNKEIRVRVTKEMAADLARHAQLRGVSESEVLRLALYEYIRKHADELS